MVIVGGFEVHMGPVLGGVFMMVLLEVAKSYGEVRNTLIGIVLVCVCSLLLPKEWQAPARVFSPRWADGRKCKNTIGAEHDSRARNA